MRNWRAYQSGQKGVADQQLIPFFVERIPDFPRLRFACCRRYSVPGCAERALGSSFWICKHASWNFNAYRDLGRHGAYQGNEVDAALTRKHPLGAGGAHHVIGRRRWCGRTIA